MPTIQMELSPDQLLKAVAQLGPDELDAFVSQVMNLHAQRRAPSLPHAEAELLLKINQSLPPELLQRYDELIAKRRAENLDSHEYDELLQLTNQVEEFEVHRVEYLAELARLRHMALPVLMETLGIRPTDHG